MLEQIGLLDDDFFFSMEDVDLAWRAVADWRCVYRKGCGLSQTLGHRRRRHCWLYDGRNALWVIAKNYPKSLWRKHWRRVLAAQWQTAAGAARLARGCRSHKLRGMAAGLVGLPRMLRSGASFRRVGASATQRSRPC